MNRLLVAVSPLLQRAIHGTSRSLALPYVTIRSSVTTLIERHDNAIQSMHEVAGSWNDIDSKVNARSLCDCLTVHRSCVDSGGSFVSFYFLICPFFISQVGWYHKQSRYASELRCNTARLRREATTVNCGRSSTSVASLRRFLMKFDCWTQRRQLVSLIIFKLNLTKHLCVWSVRLVYTELVFRCEATNKATRIYWYENYRHDRKYSGKIWC